MARLSEEVKGFIVIELACRRSPSDVVKRVGEELGMTITPQQVHEYNAERAHGKALAKKWHKLFSDTRKRFDSDRSSIAVAHANYRLREIGEAAERAKRRGNDVLLLQALKQAAEEAGGAYTNRRELTGKDGRDLPAATGAVVILPAKSPIEDERKTP